MEWSDLRSRFTGNIADVTPLHDFVIVRYLGSANERASGLILDPGNMRVTGDHRIKVNRTTGNRLGVVVACGKGDRLLKFYCPSCKCESWRLEAAKRRKCICCKGDLETYTHLGGQQICGRARMHVHPGDTVIYPQIPTNDFTCGDGELYTFCHEEQHILAVLEEEAAA